jgi:hypothetical protein
MAVRQIPQYYVYEHWRLDKDECFYVGKGKGRRAYSTYGRGSHWDNIVNKLERLGFAYEIRMVQTGLSEKKAFALEKERIAFWRDKVDLANKTDGGDGVSGLKMSDEAKAKMRAAKIGKPGNITTLGMKFSDETKAKMRASAIGKAKSPEHVKNARDAVWGKDYIPMTKEQKRERDNELRRVRRAKARAERQKEITQ